MNVTASGHKKNRSMQRPSLLNLRHTQQHLVRNECLVPERGLAPAGDFQCTCRDPFKLPLAMGGSF